MVSTDSGSSYVLLFYCTDGPEILGATFDRVARYPRLVVDSEEKAIQVLNNTPPEVLISDRELGPSIVAAVQKSETALYCPTA